MKTRGRQNRFQSQNPVTQRLTITRANLVYLFVITVIFSLTSVQLMGCASPPHRPEEEKPTTEATDLDAARKESARLKRNGGATAEYHFSLAQAYVAEGNPDRAIEEFKLTLMFDPNSSLVYARLATEYIKKGQLSLAMETCKEALQRDPKFVDARLMLAGLYSTSRETKAALAEYDTILKQDPHHDEAAVFKSQVLLEDRRSSEAIETLRGFVKRNPESILAWYYLGRTEQQLGHFKEAVTAFQKAMVLRPSFAQAALALGYLYEENRKNAEAVAVYTQLYTESQDLTAANRLATIYLKDEKYSLALPYLEAIQGLDPDDMNSQVKLGLVQMEMKRFEKAIATFQKILEKNPDSDRVHYYLGSLFEETKKPDQAIAELKKIQPDSKLFSEATLHVGYLLKQASQVEEAKAFIRDAISKSPKVPGFYIFQASLEEDTKNLPEGSRILEEALKKFPEDEKVRYYLGSLYDRQGQVDKWLEQMEAILKLNPDNVDALNYMGYTWTQKGIRLNDAEKALRRALVLRPGNAYIQDSWGWYLFVRGRTDEAVVALEKAVQIKPNEATILEHLADVYLKLNLQEKAIRHYTEAAKYAEDETARKAIESKVHNLQTGGATGRLPASSEHLAE